MPKLSNFFQRRGSKSPVSFGKNAYKSITAAQVASLNKVLPKFDHVVIIPANTLLYHASSNSCMEGPDSILRASQPGGVDFSTYPLLAATQVFNQGEEVLDFGVFVTTAPLQVKMGYDKTADNFTNEVEPYLIGKLAIMPQDFDKSGGILELRDASNLSKVQLLATYKIHNDKLGDFLLDDAVYEEGNENAYLSLPAIYDMNVLVDSGALTLFHCP